ncbi:hypothetical protein FB45DRAFT_209043 [Roridomyces roridus]|uniref:F-box domain-containing protein n=1 Tax=Roridomyces roridus TaxID=1738132 RepID=A0AAD7FX33_9AGAR|nr:hypothetical protein FB45DRAFT_209043 [Roridomyces roridus]
MASLRPFPALPAELLDSIFAWLGYTDLLAVSLTSRRMNQVAQRHLLHHVALSLTRPLVNFVDGLTPDKAGYIKSLTFHRRIFAPWGCTEQDIDRALTWLLRWTAPQLVSLTATDTMILLRPPSARPLDLIYPRLRALSVVADHQLLEAALPAFLRNHKRLKHIKIVPMYRRTTPQSPPPVFQQPELTTLECPLQWVASFGGSSHVQFANIAATAFDPQTPTLARHLALSALALNLVSARFSGPPNYILACLRPLVQHARRLVEVTLTAYFDRDTHGFIPPTLAVPELTVILYDAPQLLRVAYWEAGMPGRRVRPDDALPVARFDLFENTFIRVPCGCLAFVEKKRPWAVPADALACRDHPQSRAEVPEIDWDDPKLNYLYPLDD